MSNDETKLKQQIYNYKRKDKMYAESDPDYMNNLLPFLSFSSLEECTTFYKLWFGIYTDVLKNWDKVDERN